MTTPQYTNTLMPLDRNGRPIPMLKGSGVRVNLTAGATSSNSAIPSGAQVVFIRATDNIWYNFGTSVAVTASAASTSVLFPAGEAAVVLPEGTTHVAVLRAGSADVPVQLEKADG